MNALQDYEGPFFPDVIDAMNQVYDNGMPNLAALRAIGEMKAMERGCEVECRTVVTGGYEWFRGLAFVYPDGEVVVLFPCARDATRGDGLGLDRSIAVHTKGNVAPQEVLALLEALKEQLSRHLPTLRQAY